jgi:prepilin peptidase CpaA
MSVVLEYALLLIFPAAMAFAGAMDLFTMTIPNRLSAVMGVAFFVVAPLAGMTLPDLASHAGAGAMMLVVGFGMFALGWLGGGDAKLLAVAGLWLGFDQLLGYVLLVAIAGGMLATAILTFRSLTPPVWMCNFAWAVRLHDRTVGIPYGIALGAAALWIYPSTMWFAKLAA